MAEGAVAAVEEYYNQSFNGLLELVTGDYWSPPLAFSLSRSGALELPPLTDRDTWRRACSLSVSQLIEFGGLAGLRSETDRPRLLDIGCGVGGPARQLALECGVPVVGVDLSPQQIEHARSLSALRGLADADACFVCGSAMDLPAVLSSSNTPAGFAAAVSINMAYHVPDREAMFRGIAGCVRRGGAFVLEDWCTTSQTTEEDLRVLRNNWSSPSGFDTLESYRSALSAAGWVEEGFQDLTPVAQRLYDDGDGKFLRLREWLVPRVQELRSWGKEYGESAVQQLVADWCHLGELYSSGRFVYFRLLLRNGGRQ